MVRFSSSASATRAFTLIELLVVVSIMGLLVALLLPSLRGARQQSRAVVCASNLRVLGQGWQMYADVNRDVCVPGRYGTDPDGDNLYPVPGGMKYRPRWVAMMGAEVNARPFARPMTDRHGIDEHGEKGDRQNYFSAVYVCPSVATWTDERNAAYGYNYQFLGNVRRDDEPEGVSPFKNFPIQRSRIFSPSKCVVGADCMGTAAHYPRLQRRDYANNDRDPQRMGNEGWPLDPPRVLNELAGQHDGVRSAVDPRHNGAATTLWADGHVSRRTPEELGYVVRDDGSFMADDIHGDNRQWSVNARDIIAPGADVGMHK